MALVAMEPPLSMAAEDVRDEKTKVLRSVRALTLDDVVVGQYLGDDEHEAYRDHSDVPDDSKTCVCVSRVCAHAIYSRTTLTHIYIYIDRRLLPQL
jgi:glucose-6-phosphate 1-dehydrogenase